MSFAIDLLRTAMELIRRMLRKWYLVFASVILTMGAVTVWIMYSAPIYTSTMVVIQAERSRTGLVDALNASQAGGLLGLAFGGSTSSKLGDYLQLLQSDKLAEVLVSKYQYDKVLLQAAIDPVTGKWRDRFSRRVRSRLYGLIGVSLPDAPTIDDVRGTISAMLVYNTVPGQTTATITCRSGRPTLCPELMLLLHREAEASLNKMSLDQAQNFSSYFQKTLPTINQLELRQAIVQLLADAQKQIAMSALGEPNAAVILDPPRASSMPSAPQPELLLSLGLVFGLVFGGMLAWGACETEWNRRAMPSVVPGNRRLSPGE